MNTQENNKMIAEFMGAEKTHIQSVGDIYCPVPSKNGSEYADKLQYHSSWDWLMPVVEKILNKSDNDELIERFYEIQNVIPNREATYNAVVEFINQYNETK